AAKEAGRSRMPGISRWTASHPNGNESARTRSSATATWVMSRGCKRWVLCPVMTLWTLDSLVTEPLAVATAATAGERAAAPADLRAGEGKIVLHAAMAARAADVATDIA